MKTRRVTLSFLVLAALLAVPALAQEAVLSGRVTQEDGPPIVNATVSIPSLGLTTTTDKDGRYRLTVPAGSVNGQTVDVRVVAPGLQSKVAKVTLSAGSLTQDFALGFAFGEEVVVGSRAPGAAAEKAVPVDVYTEQQVESALASGSALALGVEEQRAVDAPAGGHGDPANDPAATHRPHGWLGGVVGASALPSPLILAWARRVMVSPGAPPTSACW